jgi:CHAD domain-containing protein
VPLHSHSQPLLRKLYRLLRDVPQKPSPEGVHRLRTTIRRMEAILDALPEESHHKLRRQLRDIRKSAGSVRDLDVQQDLLKQLRSDGHPEQKEAVALRLAKKRTKHEKRLLATLDGENVASLKKRLRRLGSELRMGGDEIQTPILQDPVRTALEQFHQLSTEIESITQQSMHEFRTRCKRIRYLAEIGAGQPDGDLVVRELKRAQDAMGAWHDWWELARLAAKVLKGTPHAMLVGVLRTTVGTQFTLALRTIREVRASLGAVSAARRKRGPRSSHIHSARTSVAAG